MSLGVRIVAIPGAVEPALTRRIAKNTGWLLLSRLGSQGLALLFSIVIARRLGEVGLGQYAFMASVVYLGNLTTTFGTDMLIMREVAAKRDFSILSASLVLQLGLSVPYIIAVFLLAPLIPNQSPVAADALRLYSLALLPLAAYSVFSAALRGLERMAAYTWLNLLNGALLAGLALVFILPDTPILTLAWLLLAVQIVSALAAVGLFFAQGVNIRSWVLSWSGLGALLSAAAPIAVLGLLGALYQRTGIIILATQQGAADTGLFSAALRVVEAAKLGHFALLGAIFPVMAQAHAAPDPKLRAVFAKTLKLLLWVASVLAGLLFMVSPLLIPALFGAEFAEAIPLLSQLAWLLIPVTLTHYFSLLLLSARQERAILVSLAASLVLLIAFVFATLPALGLRAVVWGMLLAESIQAVLLITFWRKIESR